MATRIVSPEQTTPDFYINNLPIYGKLILAPMAGYSDSPNRLIARRLGSAMSYTEFVNAIDITQDIRRVAARLSFLPEERPVVFQVFDNNLDRILSAARLLFPLQPDVLDINLGCSAPSVSNRGAGAGLLKNPRLIADIFTQLVKISPIPVTAKIRLGWDDDSRNYLEVSRILEDCGAALIAVHGRTKKGEVTGRLSRR
jgi:tRNA-dihydrouridine synthase